MKKIPTYLFLIALLCLFSISAYIIGYVNGSDKALLNHGIDQMLSIRLYSSFVKSQDMEKLKTTLLVGIEAAEDILESTTVNRSFPFGYYNQFMTLLNSDMGSDDWLKSALDSKEPATKNLKSP